MGRKTGTRHPHLMRRNNVFYVRFRIPKQLALKLGIRELCRSLRTSDLPTAKIKTITATFWFTETIAILEKMTSPTRIDLENAAREFFETLQKQIDQPRDFMSDQSGMEMDHQLELSYTEIAKLDQAIASNQFDDVETQDSIHELEKLVENEISNTDRTLVLQLIARAKRQQLRYFIHQLSEPLKDFESDDSIFTMESGANSATISSSAANEVFKPEFNIRAAGELYIEALRKEGLGVSTISETRRVLIWMGDKFGENKPLSKLSKDQLRDFRDDIVRLGKGKQGKSTGLSARLTNDPSKRLHNETRKRYWRFVRGFFSWAESEHEVQNPANGLIAKFGKAMPSRETNPLSLEEIDKFLEIPLFSGSRSNKNLSDSGSNFHRRGHWWSGILHLVYGMRGGECTQLLPSDFNFNTKIPYFEIQPGTLPDGRKKQHKNHLQTHAFPIPEELLKLGLKEFVDARSKKNRRLLFEFRLGTDRASDGSTKFWIRQLKKAGLHSAGRGTHVFRHTVVARLRSEGVSDEEIAFLQGRSSTTVTGNYGPEKQLEIKLKTLRRLPYLNGLVEKLGGAYDPKKHRP
ncbi:DUF6538 domain-containing protein [Parasphingorhabdus sp. DH2-15]|uniref:DUF6538 domain-containing protein n=1 Tax=Parasphingorhabdus sp. DH2-15 TaxID=3444112 RepID=UPI003F6896B2